MFHSIVITCWRALACFALSNKTCLDLPCRLLRWYLPGRRDPRRPPILLLAWQSEGCLFGEASVGFEKKLLGKVLFCHSMPRLQQTSLWINGPWLQESSLLTMCTFWLFKKRVLLLFYQTNGDCLPLKSSLLSLLSFFLIFSAPKQRLPLPRVVICAVETEMPGSPPLYSIIFSFLWTIWWESNAELLRIWCIARNKLVCDSGTVSSQLESKIEFSAQQGCISKRTRIIFNAVFFYFTYINRASIL